MPCTTASTEDTPILLARQLLVSSVIENAICKGFTGITETPKTPTRAISTSPTCTWLRWTRPEIPSANQEDQEPNCVAMDPPKPLLRSKCQTSERLKKTNHKVNEKKTGKRKARTSSHRRSPEIGNTKNTLKLRVTAD